MPSSTEILQGLTRVATDWIAVSVLWHAVIAWLFFALEERLWRPTARNAAIGATTPLACAAAFAWIGGNPFNGCVLGAGALALAAIAARVRRVAVRRGRSPARWFGVSLIVFAWFYPHFLDGEPTWIYVIASPIGLVPCPTLSLMIGAALYANSFGSRAWGITVGVLGMFYGIFGVVRLGVWLDLPLVAGAAFIIVTSARRKTSTDSGQAQRPATPPGFNPAQARTRA